MTGTKEGRPGGTGPSLAPHVRLTFDACRNRWVVQAPERLLVPDEIALEILQRCDGRCIAEIVADLAREFDAPPDKIARDVEKLIGDLGRKGILVT